MIRYRFETFDQLSRHLLVGDDSAFLFLCDEHRPGPQTGHFLLELKVRELAQSAVARARVLAREPSGAWLELADARLARRVLSRGEFGFRKEPRVSAEQMLQLCSDAGASTVELVDLGERALRVRGGSGMQPGGRHMVRAIGAAAPAELGYAQVIRVDGAEAALRFERPGSLPVLRLMRSMRDAWAHAVELQHPRELCGRGAAGPAAARGAGV